MNIKHILVPIDFSDSNQTLNQYASALAESTNARITYLHVSQPDVPYGSYTYIDVEQETAKDQEQLALIQPARSGIVAAHVVETGAPADQIVEFAKQNGVDLIVMGTHGRTGLRRALMGSVAESVVRHAECPVLALKPGTQIPQPG